jgi:zinc transport system ATP-binding protein
VTTGAVEFEHVSFSYEHVLVLEDVSFSIAPGEFFGIIGPNAAGKTTLLKLMLGLLAPDRGRVCVFGESPVAARPRIGYVPQHATFSRRFPITVMEVVLLGRLAGSSTFGGFTRVDREVARQSLHAVQVDDVAGRRINTLSGGQLQRVLIARALASRPDLLVLDEPTANIDLRAEENIFAMLRDFNQRMTIIVVSHDVGFISAYVDRVGCLNRTLVCHATGEISGGMIEALYGAPVKMIRHAHETPMESAGEVQDQ